MVRPQINFRLDTELLTAIKTKCETDGTSITEFLTDAARTALGTGMMERTTYPGKEVLESLTARVSELEARLVERLVNRERIEHIESRVEEVLGEFRA